jgi:hypothetical protein
MEDNEITNNRNKRETKVMIANKNLILENSIDLIEYERFKQTDYERDDIEELLHLKTVDFDITEDDLFLEDKEKLFLNLFPDDNFQPGAKVSKKTRYRGWFFRSKKKLDFDKINHDEFDFLIYHIEKDNNFNELIINGYFEAKTSRRYNEIKKKIDCFIIGRSVPRKIALNIMFRTNFRVKGPFGFDIKNNDKNNIELDLNMSEVSEENVSNSKLVSVTKESHIKTIKNHTNIITNISFKVNEIINMLCVYDKKEIEINLLLLNDYIIDELKRMK